MEKTVMGRRFNSDKYGMIYCSVCKGSDKLFDGGEVGVVCKTCGGFGLVEREEKDSPHTNGYNRCLSRTLQNERG